MTTRVFQPLGMSRTFTSGKLLAQTHNVAVPHVRVGDETFAGDFADQDNIGPAAAICSSVRDLSQWLRMIVNEGRLHESQVLKPTIVREMERPQILMPFADPTTSGEHTFNAYG